jgi:hypothetical protein
MFVFAGSVALGFAVGCLGLPHAGEGKLNQQNKLNTCMAVARYQLKKGIRRNSSYLGSTTRTPEGVQLG